MWRERGQFCSTSRCRCCCFALPDRRSAARDCRVGLCTRRASSNSRGLRGRRHRSPTRRIRCHNRIRLGRYRRQDRRFRVCIGNRCRNCGCLCLRKQCSCGFYNDRCGSSCICHGRRQRYRVSEWESGSDTSSGCWYLSQKERRWEMSLVLPSPLPENRHMWKHACHCSCNLDKSCCPRSL